MLKSGFGYYFLFVTIILFFTFQDSISFVVTQENETETQAVGHICHRVLECNTI